MAESNVATDLRAALKAVEGLPVPDVERISVLIDAGEWAIALETLCTQVYEYDCELTSALRDEMLRLGCELGVAAGYLLGDPWEGPA